MKASTQRELNMTGKSHSPVLGFVFEAEFEFKAF